MENMKLAMEDMELDNIMAEVNAEGFIEATNKDNKAVKTIQKNYAQKQNQKKNVNGIDKATAMNLAKIAAFMGVIGICGYLKLMSPILYIPIELVSLCTGCFKLGEYKGKQEAKNA